MAELQNITTGLIYSNPIPHIKSRHAYFPFVIQMDNGEMLASFAIGEAFEAVNLNTHIVRSIDGGETWSEPDTLLPTKLTEQHSNCARLTAFPNGEVIAIVVQHDRRNHLEEGLANPKTMGFVPTKVLLMRSDDFGKSWSAPEQLAAPLTGPSFELCSPIISLSDGRWIWPTSTWRDWNGYQPNGMKMVAWVSRDQGKTWPQYLDVMHDPAGQQIFWESKIIELETGSLVAAAWVYDEKNKCNSTNHYSISNDAGRIWTSPACTGLHGQTMAMMQLANGDILSIYRRMDIPGLWANISLIEKNTWTNKSTFALWGAYDEPLENENNATMVQNFNELKFGAPCLLPIQDGAIYVAFWCYEKLVSNIRWFKIPSSKVLL